MSDFWTRKREELQKEGVIPTPRQPVTQSDGPWWQAPRQPTQEQPNVSQRPSQGRTEVHGQPCPNCGSGNYWAPETSTANRCFDCGYVHGRQLNEPNLPGIATTDAPRVKTKQLEQSGHFGSSVAEINQNNAALEQSAQGRTKLN
jgi:hypothetical protein